MCRVCRHIASTAKGARKLVLHKHTHTLSLSLSLSISLYLSISISIPLSMLTQGRASLFQHPSEHEPSGGGEGNGSQGSACPTVAPQTRSG
jgi:hypothetical protein